MRDILCDRYPPRFNLDPVAIALINNLVMEFNKGCDPRVFTHMKLYQPLIKIAFFPSRPVVCDWFRRRKGVAPPLARLTQSPA